MSAPPEFKEEPLNNKGDLNNKESKKDNENKNEKNENFNNFFNPNDLKVSEVELKSNEKRKDDYILHD